LPRQYNIGVQLIRNYLARSSNSSEWKVLGFLRLEDVVHIQISNGPYQNNCGKRDEACVVVDYLGKGKHNGYPEGNIVGDMDKSIGGALFD
jgi:hypothetical protein